MRILLCFITLIHLSAGAQVIQWSNPEKFNSSVLYSKVLGENAHGVYVLRYTTKFFSQQIVVDRYHHHLKLDRSRSLELKNARLVLVKMVKQGLLVVHARYDRKDRANVLMAYYLDHDLRPMGDPIQLKSSEVQGYADRGEFKVRVSDDQRSIAVLTVRRSEDDRVQLHTDVFDSAFQLRSKHMETIAVDHRKFELGDATVGDAGQVYCLYSEARKGRKGEPERVDHLMAFVGDSSFHKAFEDSLEYRNPGLALLRGTDRILVGGFYGAMGQYGSKGVFTYSLDWRTGREELHYDRFEKELADELSLGSQDLDVIPEGFEILRLIPRTDGGLMLVAEQKDIDTENEVVMLHGIPTSTSKNIYNFNDILVLNVDSVGQVEWSEVIHKNQTTVNDGGYFSSAIVYVCPDFIQIIYNDQIRNSGEVMQHTIYTNGESSSRKLLKSAVDYVVVIPAESTQVASNKLILSSLKNRRFALFKLIYN